MDTRSRVCNEDRHRGCGYTCLLAGTGAGTSGRRALCRNIDLQYARNSVERLSERTYASGFASRTKIRRLVGRGQYLKLDADEGINELALVDFAGWCSASQGNQAETSSSKQAAVQLVHVLAVGFQRNRRSSNARCKESVGHTLPRARLVGCAVRCRGICSSKGKISNPHEDKGVGCYGYVYGYV